MNEKEMKETLLGTCKHLNRIIWDLGSGYLKSVFDEQNNCVDEEQKIELQKLAKDAHEGMTFLAETMLCSKNEYTSAIHKEIGEKYHDLTDIIIVYTDILMKDKKEKI